MESNKIPYIDFLTHLLEYSKEQPIHSLQRKGDIRHFSPKGNYIFAQTIAKRLATDFDLNRLAPFSFSFSSAKDRQPVVRVLYLFNGYGFEKILNGFTGRSIQSLTHKQDELIKKMGDIQYRFNDVKFLLYFFLTKHRTTQQKQKSECE